MTDIIKRPFGCVCTHVAGDSDCAEHPRCPNCNEALDATALAAALATARDSLRNGERVCAELVKERDEAKLAWIDAEANAAILRAEVERLTDCLKRANNASEGFERKWYLAIDERDAIKSDYEDLAAQRNDLLAALDRATPVIAALLRIYDANDDVSELREVIEVYRNGATPETAAPIASVPVFAPIPGEHEYNAVMSELTAAIRKESK